MQPMHLQPHQLKLSPACPFFIIYVLSFHRAQCSCRSRSSSACSSSLCCLRPKQASLNSAGEILTPALGPTPAEAEARQLLPACRPGHGADLAGRPRAVRPPAVTWIRCRSWLAIVLRQLQAAAAMRGQHLCRHAGRPPLSYHPQSAPCAAPLCSAFRWRPAQAARTGCPASQFLSGRGGHHHPAGVPGCRDRGARPDG